MKHISRRLLAVLLALTLTATPALASQALGWELVRSETTVGPGATVTTQKFWGDSKSDYRTEQFFTYTPSREVSPVVVYGATVPAKGTVTNMAKGPESYGNRVLAGANGDYFVVATGVPLGMVVTWGVLRSSSSYHYAVGFDANGNAIIGKPELSIWADLGGYHLAVSGGYNKTRERGLTLFSGDFGAATKGSGAGMSVVLRPVVLPEDYAVPEGADLAASAAALTTAPAQLTIGGQVTCVVEQVTDESGGVNIPEGRFVLTVSEETGEFFQTVLSELQEGEQVTLSVSSPDERWNSVQQAIGGYALLLKDGVVQDGLDNTANPRTALGVKENGQVILYTIDGRKSGHSVGASMRQVAARLQELGCVDAVLFDGGGSTTFGATGALDSAFSLQNKPSDGGQRAVSNGLFFISNLKPTGELGSLYLSPQSGLFLPGGKANLTAQGIDSGYYPLGNTVTGVTYSVAGPGAVAGSTFTAGQTTEKSEAIVTGTTADGQQGTTVLTVVPTPHAIQVTNEANGQAVTSLNLDPGQSLSLTASATWYNLPLTATDDCFAWAVTPSVGRVDPLGTLTSGAKAASGALTVTAGNKSVSIPVTVAGHVTPMEDFEGGECQFRIVSGGMAQLSGQKVKYGNQSMEVVCNEPETVLETYMGLNDGETDVSFWVYSDQAIALDVKFVRKDGTETTGSPTGSIAAGKWSFVTVNLPEGVDAVSGMTLKGAGKGKVYVDQWASTNGGIRDETPPVAAVQYANGAVTAQLSDNVDKTFDAARVAVTVDGQWIPFDLKGNVVTATADLNDARTHRISVTVTDASGNIGRGSVQIDHPATLPAPGGAGSVPYGYPFVDVSDHWAADYADYLYHQGITTGSPSAAGLLYHPGDNITRGDFVTMLCRWMGLDLSQYAHVELPFADKDAIKPWAVDAVKAAYELGIFTGSASGDTLYANANQTITRAQVITLLGRAQTKGYAISDQVFLDQDAIPDWAAEYVSTLVAQGVISGYGGYMRPQDPITRAEVAKVLSVMW